MKILNKNVKILRPWDWWKAIVKNTTNHQKNQHQYWNLWKNQYQEKMRSPWRNLKESRKFPQSLDSNVNSKSSLYKKQKFISKIESWEKLGRRKPLLIMKCDWLLYLYQFIVNNQIDKWLTNNNINPEVIGNFLY